MKLIIRRKGGKGSGFHSHAGRPGKVGGSVKESSYVKFANTYEDISRDIQEGYTGQVAYFITKDDKIVPVGKVLEHKDYLIEGQIESPEEISLVFGITPKKSVVLSDDQLDELYEYGTIRVRTTKKSVNVDTNRMDVSTLKRLQRLVDEGKLPLVGKDIVWEGIKDQIMLINVPYEEFMMAKYVVIERDQRGYRKPVLKEIVEK